MARRRSITSTKFQLDTKRFLGVDPDYPNSDPGIYTFKDVGEAIEEGLDLYEIVELRKVTLERTVPTFIVIPVKD